MDKETAGKCVRGLTLYAAERQAGAEEKSAESSVHYISPRNKRIGSIIHYIWSHAGVSGDEGKQINAGLFDTLSGGLKPAMDADMQAIRYLRLLSRRTRRAGLTVPSAAKNRS